MSQDESGIGSRGNAGNAAGELVNGISQVVGAALGVGAVLAKVVAQTTAAGREVPPPPAPAAPLNAIVHYSVAAMTNLIGVVLRGVGVIKVEGQRGERPAPAGTSPARGPQVHRGATLRIPLSIENPGDAPMTGVSFHCLELVYLGAADGERLPPEAISFHPAVLDVQSRDFEKLTVFIDTRESSASGPYRARIGMENAGFETVIEFEVIPG